MNSKVIFILTILLLFEYSCVVDAAGFRCYKGSLHKYKEYNLKCILKMLKSRYFDKNLSTFIFVHGFINTMQGVPLTNMVRGALKRGGWNVCVLNWSKEAGRTKLIHQKLDRLLSYSLNSVRQAVLVGKLFATALNELSRNGVNMTCTHMYGHSLGAQLAGVTGRALKKMKTPIGHLSGLDPAGPFYGNPVVYENPLASDCATFVDSYHTDPARSGVKVSDCHVDFWVNYGNFLRPDKGRRGQPGCVTKTNNKYSANASCSHHLPWKLIVSSWENPDLFRASKALTYQGWVKARGTGTPVIGIGEDVDKSARGNFYFRTTGVWPYGLGEKGMCVD